MDLRQLAALVAVDDHGTFSAAADALLTVQSNVSAHVARLEKELGTTLVDRAAGELTAEGRAVASRARRIQAEIDSITDDLQALADTVAGTVRLGVIGTTARWMVSPILTELAAEFPDVRVVITEASSVVLGPSVLDGHLDAAVVNLPAADRQLHSEPLFDEDLLVFIPDGHPLGDGPLTMADLADVPLLLPAPGTAFRADLDAAARVAGIELTPLVELDGVRLLAGLALDGLGPAILPATAVPRDRTGPFHRAALTDAARRTVGLARRSRHIPSAPERAVAEAVRHLVAAEIGNQPGIHPPSR